MEVKWYERKENDTWVRGMSCEGNEAADGRLDQTHKWPISKFRIC